MLVEGVAFKKTFSYAGFEQQPKSFDNPKILILNVELELKSEKDNAEIRIDNPDEYQSIVDAEWKILTQKLDNIQASGANVILSKLPIGGAIVLVLISTLLTMIAGLIPAKVASKKDPVEALRTE